MAHYTGVALGVRLTGIWPDLVFWFFLAFGEVMRRAGSRLTEKVSALAPYEDHTVERWQQGCRSATRTRREVLEQSTLVPTRTLCESPAILKCRKSWGTPTGLFAGYLRRASSQHPREEDGKPLRSRIEYN